MFGNNPRLPQVRDDNLLVKEIFTTIQGEGPFAGTPCVFIRLAGCPLQCFFCDTDFDTEGAQVMSSDEITLEVDAQWRTLTKGHKQSTTLVVITGGEPFRQKIGPLCQELLDRKLIVQIETAGVMWDGTVPVGDPYLWIVCSPKTPKLHPELEPYITDYKYIIKEGETWEEDGLPCFNPQKQGASLLVARPPVKFEGTIYVHPCDENGEGLHPCPRTRRNLEAAAKIAVEFGYTLGVQMHKLAMLP